MTSASPCPHPLKLWGLRETRYGSELEARIEQLGQQKLSWPAIIADLDALTETEVAHDDRRFLLRSSPGPAASIALRAAGVALPPTVQAITAG
jgi:hypothetical protein